MEKNERYVVAALVLVLVAVAAYFLWGSGGSSDTVRVNEDPAFAASLVESNTAIIRLYFPFSDTRGPGSAATSAVQVLSFANKTVILQVIDGNKCIRTSFSPSKDQNRPIDKNEMVLDVKDCELESTVIPTIEVRESTRDSIVQSPLLTKIEGKPQDIPKMLRFVILKAYPNADQAIAYMNRFLSNVTGR
jgi:hypothetical protein